MLKLHSFNTFVYSFRMPLNNGRKSTRNQRHSFVKRAVKCPEMKKWRIICYWDFTLEKSSGKINHLLLMIFLHFSLCIFYRYSINSIEFSVHPCNILDIFFVSPSNETNSFRKMHNFHSIYRYSDRSFTTKIGNGMAIDWWTFDRRMEIDRLLLQFNRLEKVWKRLFVDSPFPQWCSKVIYVLILLCFSWELSFVRNSW